MCVLLVDWQPEHNRLRLLGNRDEFFARPSLRADWWADAPSIYGGRDAVAGGSWLAINSAGRIAAVTNIRRPDNAQYAQSRGALVRQFLSDERTAETVAAEIYAQRARYAGFNLLLADRNALVAVSSTAPPQTLVAGVYGLSNGAINEAWPKIQRLKNAYRHALTCPLISRTQAFFALLQDCSVAAGATLPCTGMSTEVERLLAPIWVRAAGYGSRTSTLVERDTHHIVHIESGDRADSADHTWRHLKHKLCH